MFAWLRKLIAAPVFEDDEEKTRVASLLNTVLLAFLATIMLYSALVFVFPNTGVALIFIGIAALVGLSALFLLRSGRVQTASLLFSFMLWTFITIVASISGGVNGPSFFAYPVIIIIVGLLMGGRGGFFFAGLSVVAGLGMVWAETRGFLPPSLVPSFPISEWAAMSVFTIIAATILHVATSKLNEALNRARRYAAELEEHRAHLEETVEERTRDLARRTRYLEATAEVARDAASVLDLDKLLSRVVRLVSEQFGFYHTGIFLLDPTGEWAVLQAASSEGGQRMLARGHRLRVGQTGIVGYVTGHAEPRVALDVGADAVFFDNPDLPDTRSEMALPLRARGEIIGALDVQSTEAAAFSAEDVAVLQTLADQVAMAISNAQLFARAQESLQAERRAYGELSHEAWRALLRTQPDLGVLRNKRGLSPAGDLWRPPMEVALQTGETTRGEGDMASLATPLKVRGHVIGVIEARRPEGEGEWEPEQIALLETLAEQLSVALENARLYQDTQRRAIRERLIREITERVRGSVDIESILQTTVQEVSKVLGTSRGLARLGTEVELGGIPESIYHERG